MLGRGKDTVVAVRDPLNVGWELSRVQLFLISNLD